MFITTLCFPDWLLWWFGSCVLLWTHMYDKCQCEGTVQTSWDFESIYIRMCWDHDTTLAYRQKMVVLSAMSHCRNAKKYYTKDKNQSATDVRLQGGKPKPSGIFQVQAFQVFPRRLWRNRARSELIFCVGFGSRPWTLRNSACSHAWETTLHFLTFIPEFNNLLSLKLVSGLCW